MAHAALSLCLIGLSSVFGAAERRGATADVEALLARMRSTYESVRSATYRTKSIVGKKTYLSDFTYHAPFSVRVTIREETDKGHAGETEIVVDGRSLWTKPPGATAYRHEPFSIFAFETRMPANLESFCFFDSDRQLSTRPMKNMQFSELRILPTEQWNGKPYTILEETAKQQKVRVLYYISQARSFIVRTVVHSLKDNRVTTDACLTQLKLPDFGINP